MGIHFLRVQMISPSRRSSDIQNKKMILLQVYLILPRTITNLMNCCKLMNMNIDYRVANIHVTPRYQIQLQTRLVVNPSRPNGFLL